jgi:hypothetical protein
MCNVYIYIVYIYICNVYTYIYLYMRYTYLRTLICWETCGRSRSKIHKYQAILISDQGHLCGANYQLCRQDLPRCAHVASWSRRLTLLLWQTLALVLWGVDQHLRIHTAYSELVISRNSQCIIITIFRNTQMNSWLFFTMDWDFFLESPGFGVTLA